MRHLDLCLKPWNERMWLFSLQKVKVWKLRMRLCERVTAEKHHERLNVQVCSSSVGCWVSGVKKEKWLQLERVNTALQRKWEKNKPAHLSLSAPSSPSSLSAVTPPLSPSVASPPPRRLSLKRFSLFSRFPGKHSHGPEEGGGREGWGSSLNQPHHFLF